MFGRHLSILESEVPSLSKVKELHFPKSRNSIFLSNDTETTIKNDDDVSAPPPDPKSSSSFFSSDDVSQLIQAVPQERRSKQVESRLRKALKAGVTVAALFDCIAYTIDHAPKDFVAYLGLAIDKGYPTDGYRHQHEEKAAIEKQKAAEALEKQEREQAEESRRKNESEQINRLLDQVTVNGQLDELDEFISGQTLNNIEKSLFQKGKRSTLRRRFVGQFLI